MRRVEVVSEKRVYSVSLLIAIHMPSPSRQGNSTVPHLTVPAAVLLFLLASRSPLLVDIAAIVGMVLLTLCSGYLLLCCARRAFFNGTVVPTGKSVLITGCDTGFGYLLATQLAGEGFFTYAGCLDENSDGAKGLKKRANLRVLQMDVTKEEEIQAALQTVQETLDDKVLWAVVANAGVSSMGYIEWQPMSRVRSVFDVNTFGALSVATAFLPLLKKAQGRLVIVTSAFASFTMPEYVTYCMSKHALASLAEGLRRQYLNRGVHVCTVAPGVFRTAMAEHEKMSAEFDRDLELLPERVRSNVDKNCVARFKRSAEVLHNLFMKDDLQEAVDAMKMAVRDRLPRAHYRPGGWLSCLLRFLHDITPAEISDEVIDAARRIAPIVKKK
ncbi:retinol dehydrogenase 7-like [Haemaphysalis longicornis]